LRTNRDGISLLITDVAVANGHQPPFPYAQQGGRSKGTPNKVTADVREAIATLAEANVGKCQTWLDTVAEKDPARALELFVRLLEYHVPKLARTESTLNGNPGAEVVVHRIVFGKPEEAAADDR
jgi:hypothetical protein